MTSLSVLIEPPESETQGLSFQEMTEFMEGVRIGSIARSQGKVRSLDEVVAELGIL